MLSKSDLMEFSGFFICADCKPLAVAKLVHGESVGGILRDGSTLVIAHGRSLPDRCIRCNEPCNDYRLRHYTYWFHPAVYVLLLLALVKSYGFLVFLIVMMVVGKKAKLDVPICATHRKQQKRRVVAATTVAVASAGVIIGLIRFMNGSELAVGLGLLAGTIMLASIIVAFENIVKATKVTATHTFMKGAGEPFLSELPVWPRE